MRVRGSGGLSGEPRPGPASRGPRPAPPPRLGLCQGGRFGTAGPRRREDRARLRAPGPGPRFWRPREPGSVASPAPARLRRSRGSADPASGAGIARREREPLSRGSMHSSKDKTLPFSQLKWSNVISFGGWKSMWLSACVTSVPVSMATLFMRPLR